MKKQNILLKGMLCMGMALATFSSQAQFLETMGTVGSATETIAVHEANGRFSVTSLTYSGTADMRTTTPSTTAPTYAGASGSFNTLIQPGEEFNMQVIDASQCSSDDSLFFGIHKNTNASTGIDFLNVEYSINNGTSWVNMPYAALPSTGTGNAHWYKRGVALPVAAQVSNLWIRFRNSQVGGSSANPQFRIDDIQSTCGTSFSCGTATSTISVAGPRVYCATTASTTISVATSLSSPSYQWYNQNGLVAGATSSSIVVNTSGTYYVKINNVSTGCEVISSRTNVLVYPKPSYCVTEVVTGCPTATVPVTVQVEAKGLIFSQYVEGSGNNKYLELYNGTCDDVNLANYELRAFHNGAAVPTYTIPLTGFIFNQSTFVIADTNATLYSTPDLITPKLQFNGNDALGIYNLVTNQYEDIFGSIGHDPGTSWRDTVAASATKGWTTVNKTLVRKACVYSGITANPDLDGIYGFPTLLTEWDTLSLDNVTGLGAHTIGANSYVFQNVSGPATVVSSTGNTAQILIGNGASVISVNGTFCTFNDCSDINNLINTDTSCVSGLRSAVAQKAGQAVANVYPNPFNTAATITFHNATAGEVEVILVDMYGKSVSVVNSQYMEAGAQRVELNVAALAAGTYVCVINTPNGQETLRVVRMNK
jgi:hypothetical protein